MPEHTYLKGTMDLQSRTALVTGGAVRIGRTICSALAANGCGVAIHYHRSENEARSLARELGDEGNAVMTVRGDVTVPDSCRRIIGEVCEKQGLPDILINNAAIFHRDSVAQSDESGFDREIAVNFRGPERLSRMFAEAGELAAVDRVGVRKIVNLLDRRIADVDSGSLSYSISKKMLAEYTMAAAVEFAPKIAVNAVAPGAVLPPRAFDGRKVSEPSGYKPLERQCSDRDVADAVVFLLECDALTGQVIFVDSGQHLCGV